MANQIRNTLTVVGEEEELNRFIAAARGRPPRSADSEDDESNKDEPKEEALCFHSLVPLPESYGEVPYGLTQGFATCGFDLEVETWGVKWGAYDQKGPFQTKEGDEVYSFTTAWSPPTKFLENVAKQWTRLEFFL